MHDILVPKTEFLIVFLIDLLRVDTIVKKIGETNLKFLDLLSLTEAEMQQTCQLLASVMQETVLI